jgi:cytochrome c-type biogenesis protein CcmE
MTRKQRRLTLIGAAGAVLTLSLGLVLYALDDQIVFFFSPSDVMAKEVAPGARIRLGGLVAEGSIQQSGDGGVQFVVTDTANQIPVSYRGILPDLFREGQGVVAEGSFDEGGHFLADSVLARHDEAYMPREVADALKAQGHWQEEAAEGYQ